MAQRLTRDRAAPILGTGEFWLQVVIAHPTRARVSVYCTSTIAITAVGPAARALPRDAVVVAVVARAAPQRAVRLVEEDRGDRPRGARLDLEAVAHLGQLAADPGRQLLVDQHLAWPRVVRAERAAHLVAVDVGRLARLLDVHPELDDVEEELEQVLVLRVAALDRERQVGLAVLERQARGQGRARVLARLEDVERVLGGVEHEALHPLAQPDAGLAGDHGGDPAAARRDRD